MAALPPSAHALAATSESFAGTHIIYVAQFDRDALRFVCEIATLMRTIVETRSGCDLLRHKVLANVFYEPSTRTSSSFAAAMHRLGGAVLQINESTSSAVKGETLHDTVKSLECYADAIVLRHPQLGSAAVASAASSVPLLNAGDGVGEHPTQALLDFFTIVTELGPGVLAGEPLRVTLLGDLKHGRTVHSLARLLALFPAVSLSFVAPAALAMPEHITAELAARQVRTSSHAVLGEVIASTDVLYVTRVQKERFASPEAYEHLRGVYVVTPETLALAKPRMVVMHPLPRVGEITEAVDADPRAAYFRQMRNGLYVRMALLALCLGVKRADIEAAAAGEPKRGH